MHLPNFDFTVHVCTFICVYINGFSDKMSFSKIIFNLFLHKILNDNFLCFPFISFPRYTSCFAYRYSFILHVCRPMFHRVSTCFIIGFPPPHHILGNWGTWRCKCVECIVLVTMRQSDMEQITRDIHYRITCSYLLLIWVFSFQYKKKLVVCNWRPSFIFKGILSNYFL